MGWNNCTQQEAQDAYDYAKGNYQRSSEAYLRNKQTLDKYEYDYVNEKNSYNNAAADKVNFEKRIEGIEEIISLMEVNGYCNERINDANATALKIEEKWEGYIKCPEVGTPEVYRAFKLPSVIEDAYSELALLKLKNEKNRLVQAVADLNRQMQQMEESINQMVSAMNAIQTDQAALSKAMTQSAYEMNHYKKFL